MDVDLALLADAATLDATGKLNILGVFDRIDVHEFPARHGRIALVLRIRAGLADAGEHAMKIRMVAPSGQELLGLEGTIQLAPAARGATGGETRVPQIFNLDGVVFTVPGVHSFDVTLDGEHQVSVPLTVVTSGLGHGQPAQA